MGTHVYTASPKLETWERDTKNMGTRMGTHYKENYMKEDLVTPSRSAYLVVSRPGSAAVTAAGSPKNMQQQRFSPGHPYRLSPATKKKGAINSKMHKAVEVWLLDIHGCEDLEEGKPALCEGGFSEINLNDEMAILKGNTTLNPLHTCELSIRQTLKYFVTNLA